MNERQERVLARAAAGLRAVDGVVALVLGGSHARGTARPDSDLDLGLYYRQAAPPDLVAVRAGDFPSYVIHQQRVLKC